MSVEHEGPPARGNVAGRVPWQVRTAGVLVGLEALVGLVFAGALAIRAGATAVPVGLVVGQSGLFVLLGGALVAVARGLVLGRRWARAPAIVTQLLLLPVAYSMIGPSRQLVVGIPAGALLAGCLLLLIGEAARAWSESA